MVIELPKTTVLLFQEIRRKPGQTAREIIYAAIENAGAIESTCRSMITMCSEAGLIEATGEPARYTLSSEGEKVLKANE